MTAQNKQLPDNFRDYMLDPNNILLRSKSTINTKQKVLGIISIDQFQCKFYFCETNIGRDITSTNSEYVKHTRTYLHEFYTNTIDLKSVLINNGATILFENKEDCDIDLSPESLDKNTIINLLS